MTVTGLLGALLLTACGGPAQSAGREPSRDDGRPVVLATFTVLADMVAAVAGPDARVESLTDPGTEIHGYEPSPDDLRRAAGADLMIANGLGLEAWLEGLVAPLDLPTVVVADGLTLPPTGSGGAPHNPHAWMSPTLGQQYARVIAEALAVLDPDNAAGYTDRAEEYAGELGRLHGRLVARLAELPRQHRLLVTCEGAFGYLARDAGLEEAYLWPVNAERQGTPQQVAAVIRTVQERDVPAVFCESTISATAQQQVARETGARYAGALYVDSLSGPDGPVPTYLDLLTYDVDLIVAGLTGTDR